MRPRDIIGKRMGEIRAAQKLSLRGLAERMQEIGGEPVHASALQRIEKAEAGRGVTVEELLALAAALGVPPVALLTTRTDAEVGEPVRIGSNLGVPMNQFRGWVMPSWTSASNWSYTPVGHHRANTLAQDNGLSDEQRQQMAQRGDDHGEHQAEA